MDIVWTLGPIKVRELRRYLRITRELYLDLNYGHRPIKELVDERLKDETGSRSQTFGV